MNTIPSIDHEELRSQLEGNANAKAADILIQALGARRMTADAAAQASATVVVAHAALALAYEVRQLANQSKSADFFARPGTFHHDDGGPLAGSTLLDEEAVEIPTAEDLEHAIEVLATDLWEADTYKNTPARTFGEDYANAQDRYRVMARAILAPEPVEPEAKR